MDNEKEKLPYKLFAYVVGIVALVTFLIMNYNPVPITFIFFTIKVPLTLLFFILLVLGAIMATFYWKSKYKKLKSKYERSQKLLFAKEQLEMKDTEKVNEDKVDGIEV